MDVFDLVAKLTLDSSEYDKSLGEAEQKGSSFGNALGAIGGVVGGVGGAFTMVAGTVGAIGTAAVSTGKELWKATSGLSEYGDNIDKMSQKMGISAQAYQEWDAVMQHSGSSVESLKMGFKTLNSQLVGATETINQVAQAEMELDAQLESGEIDLDEYNAKYDELYEQGYKGIEPFEKLGFSMQDVADMAQSPEDAFNKIITALQQMPEGTERTALATELLGRSAMELGPLLNTSAEETQAMKDRVHELGGVMSDEAVKSAAQFQDNLQDLQTAMDGLKRGILGELLPSFNDLMDGFTKLISGEEGADDAIMSGLDKLLDGAGNIADKFLNIGAEIIPRLITGLVSRFPDFISALASVSTTIVPVLLETLRNDVFPSLMTALPEIISTYMGAMPELIQSSIDLANEFIPMIVDLATQLISQFATSFADVAPMMYPASVQVMLVIVNAILKNLPTIFDAAIEITMGVIDGMVSMMPELVSAVIQLVMQIVATIIELIPHIISAGVKIIVELLTTIVNTGLEFLSGNFWRGLLDGIVKSFTDIDWAGIGTMLTEGIANGIKNGFNKVKESVTNVADGIKNIFTGIFDIHSPSRLFEEYGEMIDEGLALGIGSGLSVDATKKMSNNVSESFSPSLAGVGGGATINLWMDSTIVQTWVVDALDMANMRSGGR